MSAAFLDASATAGFDYRADLNDPDADGAGPVPLNAVAGSRVSTAAAYLVPNLGRPNLRVRTDAVARRVVFAGARAAGVEVDVDGARRVLRGREVVLCCGAVGTPHLLLHSGIGPAQHLSDLGLAVVADLRGVGHDSGVRRGPSEPALEPRPGGGTAVLRRVRSGRRACAGAEGSGLHPRESRNLAAPVRVLPDGSRLGW